MRAPLLACLVVLSLACLPAGPALAAEPSGKLAYNAWCFNILLNQGVRNGYADDHDARLAAQAMGDARQRLLAIVDEDGLSEADFLAIDRRYFDATVADAQAIAAGTASEALAARYDGCRARGLRGMHAEKRHAAFLDAHGEQMWCQMTMAHFTAREMIGGGPERAERGARASRVLKEIVNDAFNKTSIAFEDRDLLIIGNYFRTMVQVEAFGIGGGKQRMERDYEPCFDMASLPFPANRFQFPPAAEVRPARTPAAWDYPLSFEFRQLAWCRELVRLVDADPVVARSYPINDAGKAEIADHADRALAAEAAALNMSDADLAAVAQDTRLQVAHEFQRYDATGNYDQLAYDAGSCALIGAEDRLGDLLAKSDAERFDESIWCLAALEALLARPTQQAARIEAGVDHFAKVAAGLASDLGIDHDALLGRLGQAQFAVDAEIGTRAGPDGSGLMLDYCASLLPL